MHPLAWWAWAFGLAVATVRTTSPLVVWLVLASVVVVVLACRADTPWGRAFSGYLVLGGVVVVARVLFYVVVGIKVPGTVALDLPGVALPAWAAGVELFGPVTWEGLAAAAMGGVRLATLIVCFGAANALANPKRALRTLPAALHQMGTAVVIAVSVAPQLVASAAGVRRAQRLRGQDARGLRSVLATLVPVLTDALDRSLALAASMDSRGYGRSVRAGTDGRVGALLAVALLAASVGTYGLLDGTAPRWIGLPALLVGAAAAVVASVMAGRRVRRTRYRPDPWRPTETVVALSGLLSTVVLVAGVSAGALVGVLAALGTALALLPLAVVRPWQEGVA